MTAALPFRDINVHASSSHYAFSSPSSPSSPTLVVDRPSGDIRLNEEKLPGAKRVSSIAGLLGIIRLRLDRYIVVINKAKPVGRIRGHMIYKVVTTELLPLQERPLRDPDEDAYLSLVKSLLRTAPLFFSYTFDLTNSFQRQSQSDPSVPLWKRADDRFFWNRFIQTDLIDLRTKGVSAPGFRQALGQEQPGVDPFILPVIFGIAEVRDTSVKGNPLTFILITRRSRHRGGTRYFSRGINEHGHVANFNETEQAIILNDSASGSLGGFSGDGFANGRTKGGSREAQILSYVQTRGSVPVFWAEMNTLHYTPVLQVRGVESAVRAAKRHFDEQIRVYGDNYLVNLVNQKGREWAVKNAYEQLVKLLISAPVESTTPNEHTQEQLHVIDTRNKPKQEFDRLHYVYFDFHNETKGLKWHRAELLMNQLHDPILNGGYFRGVDLPADTMRLRLDGRRTQRCVVRTNCMDCLDRTNVVQSMLGRFVLTRQLIDLGVLREGESAQDDVGFEMLFRNVWADNADVVSRAYSGTGALKTDFTRTGMRTRRGMFADFYNSTTRYFRNNFTDGPRQDAFDLLLGAYLPEETPYASGSGSKLFADRRPLFIQAVPYILAFAMFFVLVGSFTRRGETAAVWPLRLLMIVSFALASACFHFIWTYGTLYVNWPRLNTPAYATEGYQDALVHVQNTPFIGTLAGGLHQRGRSDTRTAFLEEGKKRIE